MRPADELVDVFGLFDSTGYRVHTQNNRQGLYETRGQASNARAQLRSMYRGFGQKDREYRIRRAVITGWEDV